MKHKLIHLVADYGVGDPAFTEVIQKLMGLDPDARVLPTSVPAFSTLSTGFWICQLATVNPVSGMIIYANTAPRKDKKEVRDRNEGERLMYSRLDNGVTIVGVNAGFCFSFIKPYMHNFRIVDVENKGSQFRSRDFYPEAVISISHGQDKYLGQEVNPETIAPVPPDQIAWIDGYGNIKTTTRVSSLHFKPGQPVLITLNGMSRTAFYTDGTFAVRDGELAYAPGSSGGKDRFMEIFLRGLSAWVEFGKPRVEQDFTVISQ